MFFGAIHRCFEHHLHAYEEEGWKRGFPTGLCLTFVFYVRYSFGREEVSLHFYRGLICMCCVCVCTHTHIQYVGYSDEGPGIGRRHPESPEEIQMYCSDSIHIYCTLCAVQMCRFMLSYK